MLILAFTSRAELKTDIVFATAGGTNLTLDAFIPEGSGPFPTCILVHGGAWMNGSKTTYITPLFEPLSKAGFTWFTINYRLAPQHRFPACIEDVESAIRWVKAHATEYKGDPQRIALIGPVTNRTLEFVAGMSQAREVYDVSGAGDTVIATLGLMMAAGVGMSDAMRIANRAAGVVVGKLGTATVTRDELISSLQ